MIGPIDVDWHRLLKARGIDLHVFVRGVDVTSRCRYADDTPGGEVAVLYRHTAEGHCHLDEDGYAAVEVADADVVIRTVELEP